jgi:hypothetical protein
VNIESERQAFEKWLHDTYSYAVSAMAKDEDGRYINDSWDDKWDGWLARCRVTATGSQ